MESFDDGLTWGSPYVLRFSDGSSPATIDAGSAEYHQSMDPLPDGGPILLDLVVPSGIERPTIRAVPMFDALPAGNVLTRVVTRAATLADMAPRETARTREAAPPEREEPPPGDPAPARGTIKAAPVAAATAGGVAALGLALALTEAGRYGAGASAFALYSRLVRSDLLRNEIRSGIHRHVEANPGIRYERLRRDLALSNGALAFHLRILVREGYVHARSEWTRRRFFVTGAAPPPPDPSDARGQLLRALDARRGDTAASLAAATGMSRQLARYHLKAMTRDGVLEPRPGGAYARVATRPRVAFEPVERR